MMPLPERPARSASGSRPSVLVVGPMYPQGGGVGMVDHILLHGAVAERFDMQLLDTARGQAGAGKEGRLALVNLYYFLVQAMRLLRLLLVRRPAIVHQTVTDSIAFWKESVFMVLARLCGAQVVAHVHGNRLEPQLLASGPLKGCLMRKALRIPSAVIVLSEHYRRLLAPLVSPEAELAVVPNSVDPLVAGALGASLAGHAGCTVLFLGFVGARKGVPDALAAIPLVREAVPDVHFVFAGPYDSGPDRTTVEAACQAARASGLASFPGQVTGGEKLALLANASVFILPSYHENLPVAILEAMAVGLPVVSTRVAGIAEIVEDGRNGFLIEPGDYRALANRIVCLARDPGLRLAMGEANVAKVRGEYSPELFAARVESVYCRLLASGQPDGATASSPASP